MTDKPQRIISKGELCKRVTLGRTQTYEACKPGKRLSNAITPDGKVDLDHPDAYAFCVEHGYKEPDSRAIAAAAREKERAKVNPHVPTAPPMDESEYWQNAIDAEHAPDDATATDIMGMTYGEIVARYGRNKTFKDFVDVLHKLTNTRKIEEEAARKRNEHVPLSIVLALGGHVDALQTSLLNEAAQAITNKVRTLVKAEADDKRIERAVHDIISRTVKSTKAQTDRTIQKVVKDV